MKRLLATLLAATCVLAEMNHQGNPAFIDRMESMRLNPALAAWQPLAFSMDWELLNAGLAGSPTALNQGGFQVTLPRYNLVLLVDHRDTDLLRESELALDWAWRPTGGLAVGIEAGMRHFGWNRDRLDNEVLQDPVFADGTHRWQPLLGLGVTWSPLVGLQTALSFKRLNRPALSLQGNDSRAPMRVYGGVSWRGEQLRLGLSVDNLRQVTEGDGLVDDLSQDLQAALQIGWRALDQLELLTDLRQDFISVDLDLRLESGHAFGYEYRVPLGDLAEQSDGGHRLRYRYSLGGALAPAGSDLRPRALPADRWRGGCLVNFFGRRWVPEKTPVALRSLNSQLELLELHVHVDDELAAVLTDSRLDVDRLAVSGLLRGERSVEPEASGVVRETYSSAWWQLSSLLEELAWDAGVRPVVHLGEDSGRVEDLANLLGAPVDAGSSGVTRLPDGNRLLLPDALALSCKLEPELEEQAGSWSLRLQLPEGPELSVEGRGAPPGLISLPLGSPQIEMGDALLRFDVYDESGRRMITRTMELPVLRRVRHVHLGLADPATLSPQDVDGIHLHLEDMNEEK